MYLQISMFTEKLFEFVLLDHLNHVVMRSTFMYTTYDEVLEAAEEQAGNLDCRLLDIVGDEV